MDIDIVEKEIGNVVEIEECSAMWKMPMILGKDFQKLLDCLKSQNAECAEAPYTRYVDVDWDSEMGKSKFAMFLEIFTKKWHFFAGMPTSSEVEDQGECKTSSIGMRKYVKTVHMGPYQKVGATYKKMQEWWRRIRLK